MASILNIKRSTYQAYEEGRSEPPYDILFRIADIHGVSARGLVEKDLSGEKTKPKEQPEEKMQKLYLLSPPHVKKAINELLQIK